MTKGIIPQDFHLTSTSICSSNTDIFNSVAQVPSGNIAEAISSLSQHVNRRNPPLLCALRIEANACFQMTTPQSNSTTFALNAIHAHHAQTPCRPRKRGNIVRYLSQGGKRLPQDAVQAGPRYRIREGEDKVWLHQIRRNTNHLAQTARSRQPSPCQGLS